MLSSHSPFHESIPENFFILNDMDSFKTLSSHSPYHKSIPEIFSFLMICIPYRYHGSRFHSYILDCMDSFSMTWIHSQSHELSSLFWPNGIRINAISVSKCLSKKNKIELIALNTRQRQILIRIHSQSHEFILDIFPFLMT